MGTLHSSYSSADHSVVPTGQSSQPTNMAQFDNSTIDVHNSTDNSNRYLQDLNMSKIINYRPRQQVGLGMAIIGPTTKISQLW